MRTFTRTPSIPALANPPAGLHIRLAIYLRRNPEVTKDLLVRFLVVVAGVAFQRWILIGLGALLLVPPVLRYRRLEHLMRFGEPFAAKVVSLDPAMIAVYSDLSRSLTDPHPVVTLVHANLEGEPKMPERGDRIAVVGQMVGGTSRRHDRVDVWVASNVVDDPKILDHLIETIPDWQWDDLDEALFEVPQPFAVGTYRAG